MRAMPGGVWLAAWEAIHTSGTSILSSVGTTTASGIDLGPAMRDWPRPPIAPRPQARARKRQGGPSWACRAPCRLISAGHTRGHHRQTTPAPHSQLHRPLPLSSSSAAPPPRLSRCVNPHSDISSPSTLFTMAFIGSTVTGVAGARATTSKICSVRVRGG